MLPSNFKALLAEVVTHRGREHHAEVDKAIREFTYKMARQGILYSSAFNDGNVRIYCEAFEKFAAGVWEDMQRVLAGGFEVYPCCEDDLINFLKESLAVVCEADTKSLFAEKNVAVHTLTARHLAQHKPRFEFHCRAVIEKLTTEIKIFVNQLRAMKEKEAKPVAIAGRGENSWLQGLSALLEASKQAPPDSVADMLKRGENPFLAGLSLDTLNKSKSNPPDTSTIRAKKNKRKKRTEKRPTKPAIRKRARSKKAHQPKPVARIENDFFTSIKDAAAYAGKTERTILNWKKVEWLKVEQNGKKIRIAKTELDKCIRKQ